MRETNQSKSPTHSPRPLWLSTPLHCRTHTPNLFPLRDGSIAPPPRQSTGWHKSMTVLPFPNATGKSNQKGGRTGRDVPCRGGRVSHSRSRMPRPVAALRLAGCPPLGTTGRQPRRPAHWPRLLPGLWAPFPCCLPEPAERPSLTAGGLPTAAGRCGSVPSVLAQSAPFSPVLRKIESRFICMRSFIMDAGTNLYFTQTGKTCKVCEESEKEG